MNIRRHKERKGNTIIGVLKYLIWGSWMRKEELGLSLPIPPPSEFPQKINVVDICCLVAQHLLSLIPEMPTPPKKN